MARIRSPGFAGAELVLLPAQTLGRIPDLRLHDPDQHVSGHHAELRWTGAGWQVEDLGSRNGTWVDGQRLYARQSRTLRRGTVLAVGRPDNGWVIVDDAPPQACAVAVDGRLREARDGLLPLPDESGPTISVYLGPEGAWMMDSAQGTEPVRNGARVHDGEQGWILHLPEPKVQTITRMESAPIPSAVDLVLHLTGVDELREVHLEHEGRRMPVDSRTGAQLLLYLARAWVRDAKAPRPGGHAEAPGWVEQALVEADLGLSANAVNVAVHRLRKLFQETGLTECAGAVERRQRPGELRLGFRSVRVLRA